MGHANGNGEHTLSTKAAGSREDGEFKARIDILTQRLLNLGKGEFLQLLDVAPSQLDAFMRAEHPKAIIIKDSRRDYILGHHRWVCVRPEQIVLTMLDPHEIRVDKAYNAERGSKELRVIFYRSAPEDHQMAVVVTFRPTGSVSHSIHTAFSVKETFMDDRRNEELMVWGKSG